MDIETVKAQMDDLSMQIEKRRKVYARLFAGSALLFFLSLSPLFLALIMFYFGNLYLGFLFLGMTLVLAGAGYALFCCNKKNKMEMSKLEDDRAKLRHTLGELRREEDLKAKENN